MHTSTPHAFVVPLPDARRRFTPQTRPSCTQELVHLCRQTFRKPEPLVGECAASQTLREMLGAITFADIGLGDKLPAEARCTLSAAWCTLVSESAVYKQPAGLCRPGGRGFPEPDKHRVLQTHNTDAHIFGRYVPVATRGTNTASRPSRDVRLFAGAARPATVAVIRLVRACSCPQRLSVPCAQAWTRASLWHVDSVTATPPVLPCRLQGRRCSGRRTRRSCRQGCAGGV